MPERFYTATHLQSVQMVQDLPLKDEFKSLCSLSSSTVANIGACMMSINMFKLVARELWRVTHCSPSLCAVFEMPRFIHSGPARLWA